MKHPIPDAALQQHIAVLGKTRSGKSSVMRGLVEDLLERGEPVCIVDPKGDWWGIKLAKDGKRPGYPVVIFGGEHADVPINAHAGAHVAELFATGNRPCLIDLGGWMVGERTRFWIEFASTLFKHTRGMRWLVVDEVHNFAPKGKIMDPDAGKALHWTNRLASEGLGKGLPMIFASQRPQKVHNDTLTSAETLIAMRVLHPSDRAAVSDWIKGCGDPELGAQVLATLAQMDRGEGWVWSPEIGFGPERVKFPMFKTYDSFRPQTAEDAKGLKGWAEVDLDDVKAKLAVVVKEVEANDPATLRAEVARLHRELAKKTTQAAAAPTKSTDAATVRTLRRALEDAMKVIVQINTKDFLKGEAIDRTAIEAAIQTATQSVATMVERHLDIRNKEFDGLKREAQRVLARLQALIDSNVEVNVDVRQNEPFTVTPAARASAKVIAAGPADSALGNSGKRRMLIALAQYHQLTPTKLSILTGIARSGGTWRTYLGELRSSGLAEGSDPIAITDAGLKALGQYDPLPTGDALVEYWRQRLGDSGKRKIFDAVVSKYPRGAPPEQIARETEIVITGGTWRTYLGELRGLELITGRGELRASDDLFR